MIDKPYNQPILTEDLIKSKKKSKEGKQFISFKRGKKLRNENTNNLYSYPKFTSTNLQRIEILNHKNEVKLERERERDG